MKCFHKYCSNSVRKKHHAEFSTLCFFFRFSKNQQLRKTWLEFCGLPWNFQISEMTRLCSVSGSIEEGYLMISII